MREREREKVHLLFHKASDFWPGPELNLNNQKIVYVKTGYGVDVYIFVCVCAIREKMKEI